MDLISNTPSFSTNGKYAVKTRLLDREHIDGRSRALKKFNRIVAGITADLGHVSTMQLPLIESYATWVVTLDDLNARSLSGEKDVDEPRKQASLMLLRLATKLGINIHNKPRGSEAKPSLFTALRRRASEADACRRAHKQQQQLRPGKGSSH